jgi:hypothetical protein
LKALKACSKGGGSLSGEEEEENDSEEENEDEDNEDNENEEEDNKSEEGEDNEGEEEEEEEVNDDNGGKDMDLSVFSPKTRQLREDVRNAVRGFLGEDFDHLYADSKLDKLTSRLAAKNKLAKSRFEGGEMEGGNLVLHLLKHDPWQVKGKLAVRFCCKLKYYSWQVKGELAVRIYCGEDYLWGVRNEVMSR